MRFQKGNKIGPRFKPGKSGNPGGRPKSKLLTAVVQELLEEKLSSPVGRRQFKESLWKRLLSYKVAGAQTTSEVWMRTEGKVRDGLTSFLRFRL